MELTLSIIKPGATQKNCTGAINQRIEEKGFRIVAQKRLMLSLHQAGLFYHIHKERPFFQDLCRYMSSGPIVAQVLKKENAVSDYRELMGATDPGEAASGTLRKDFGQNIEDNGVHGSDSLENALQEIAFFFSRLELVG